jgi:hypothetical protein
LVIKIEDIEKESNINFDEYQEKLRYILSNKKELISLELSVNYSLKSESGKEKIAKL